MQTAAPALGPNVPVLQGVHAEALGAEYWPFGHRVHSMAMASWPDLNMPAAQNSDVGTEVSVHFSAPAAGVVLPTAHALHTKARSPAAYKPTGHAAHSLEPGADANFPGEQLKHIIALL